MNRALTLLHQAGGGRKVKRFGLARKLDYEGVVGHVKGQLWGRQAYRKELW
jgi:hypothetical protein